jgi:hypothetical protein
MNSTKGGTLKSHPPILFTDSSGRIIVDAKKSLDHCKKLSKNWTADQVISSQTMLLAEKQRPRPQQNHLQLIWNK